MVYGYARCSIDEGRNDVDCQERALRKLGVSENEIYYEYERYRKMECSQFKLLLSTVSEGDTIITTGASRLACSAEHLCEIIQIAKKRKLELVIGKLKIDCRTELDPMTAGMLELSAVLARMERKTSISSGMIRAQTKGKKLGRPATTIENLPAVFLRNYPKYELKEITQEELAKRCGLSRQTISKYVKICKEKDDQVSRVIDKITTKKNEKELKKEEKRTRDLRRLPNSEVIDRAYEADPMTDEYDEIMEELERREIYMLMTPADEEIDLSEFDV